MSISIQKPFAPMALLALAMSVRDNLLGCGHTVFRNGDAECIKKYTSGMQDLVQLMKRLEVLGQIVSFSCLEKNVWPIPIPSSIQFNITILPRHPHLRSSMWPQLVRQLLWFPGNGSLIGILPMKKSMEHIDYSLQHELVGADLSTIWHS